MADYTVEVSGQRFDVKVIGRLPAAGAAAGPPAASSGVGRASARPRPARRERAPATAGSTGDELRSPMQGTVLKLLVEAGSVVEEGALVAIVEAMKMETEVVAHKSGRIAELRVAVGASVAQGDTVAVIATVDDQAAG